MNHHRTVTFARGQHLVVGRTLRLRSTAKGRILCISKLETVLSLTRAGATVTYYCVVTYSTKNYFSKFCRPELAKR